MATTVDGINPANCSVTVNTKTGYVYYLYDKLLENLNVRSAPNLNGNIIDHLYDYDKVEILGTVPDTIESVTWDKITYNNSAGFAYVSNAYIKPYISPPDTVVLQQILLSNLKLEILIKLEEI